MCTALASRPGCGAGGPRDTAVTLSLALAATSVPGTVWQKHGAVQTAPAQLPALLPPMLRS